MSRRTWFLLIAAACVIAAFFAWNKWPRPTPIIPFVILSFLFFALTTAVEKSLLRAPWRFVFFFAAAAGIRLAFAAGNRRYYRGAALIYEEQPEPALVTFPDAP